MKEYLRSYIRLARMEQGSAATPARPGEPTACAAARGSPRSGRLSVRSVAGAGKTPHNRRREGDTCCGRYSGSGLGLAIAKAIAEACSGRAEVKRVASARGRRSRSSCLGTRAKVGPVARILIAEDDRHIGASVEKFLRDNGFATLLADDGEKAQSLALTDAFDLLILDMGLPEREGFHVLQELRARGKRLPVLVLTGRSDSDVVACLDAGADDYMRKPFDFDELLARVRTRIRQGRRAADPNVLVTGQVRLDVRSRHATTGDRTASLTPREFALLEMLLRHAGQILSRRQLAQAWGDSVGPESNTIDVAVNALRKKLGADAIETVRGAGYRVR
jgi:DNA-binding response OmpR family regulator